MNLKALSLTTVFVSFEIVTCYAQSFNSAKADSLLSALADNNKVMMSVSIMKDGKPLYTRAVGYSTYGAQKKQATVNTKYRIGSVTKMFTAVIIFQLIEEGKLTLETPLSKYYPQIPDAASITIAQMLNHSSGVHNFTSNADKYSTWSDLPQTHDQMIARMQVPLDFKPGEKHQYSNSNFVLLGYIIERLDKRAYASSVKSRITEKLKLTNTYYGGNIDVNKDEAQSFKWVNNTWETDTETDMSVPAGAGALVSTPADLNTFITALFTSKLVGNESLAQMKTIKDGYGMNLRTFKFAGHVSYGHTGEIDSFQSQSAFFPEDGIALSHVANGVNTDVNEVMRGLLSIVFNRPYIIPNVK